MKKKIGITVGTMAVAALIGLGFSQTGVVNADPALNVKEIKAKVTDQYPGTITELELDERANKPIYEIEIKNDNREYELKVDGNTGEVLTLDEKAVKNKPSDVNMVEKETIDNKKEGKNDSKATDDDNQTKNDDNRKGDDDKGSAAIKPAKKAVIGDEKARSIAASQFSGSIVELDLDEDDGRLIYEIEMKNGDSEAEIEIDAYTGTILVVDIDQDDDDNDDDNNDNDDD
jgi:uncharacterized membrane protein YkoI